MVQLGQLPLNVSRLASNICMSTKRALRILQTSYDQEQICDLMSLLLRFLNRAL
jgi:hypothetical protein